MAESVAQIRCPNCKNPIQARVEQLIDVGRDPSAKARFLSGALNHIRCPICGYEGQLATPIVYHDPAKELLLTHIPVEIGLNRDDQERAIGGLIKQVMDHLPPEARKAYLLQPQEVLTLQGMMERVLEADGITREEIEAQQAKMRLFMELLETPEENLAPFVSQHDSELDAGFFQLATLALQTTREPKANEAAAKRVEAALPLTSFGKRLQAQEAEVRLAAESLRESGEGLTREKLIDLFAEAPNDDRVMALVNLTAPALDYSFFQLLSERIDKSAGEEKARLDRLRARVLEITQELNKAQEERAAQAASLLRSIMEAEDLGRAVKQALPMIDELFLGILQANMRAAAERKETAVLDRLTEVDRQIRQAIRDSLPPSLQLAQDVLAIEDQAEAESRLESSADQIDEQVLSALMSGAQRMEQQGLPDRAEKLRRLHRHALRLAMRAKMAGGGAPQS
jgi:hypothetical protein